MQFSPLRRTRIRRSASGLAAAAVMAAVTVAATAQPGPASAATTALHVSGNQLVDAAGHPVQLVGVNRSGTEYACAQGWGIFDGPSDAASVAAMASWHVNAVRVPLNEDCWLGINGVNAAYSGANYQKAIENYVSELNSAGLVAIIDLHWGAPGQTLATSQEEMPDADHAPAFWTSAASAFKSTPGVIFDAFNEPHDVSWSCWLDGCTLANGVRAAGMQTLVNAIRSTGATQPIMVEGLAWGGDLSGFVANEPSDPDHNLIASAHLYNFSGCNTASCWDSTIAPAAQVVPVVTGEIGETDCTSNWIDTYMSWADSHHISYLAWAWDTGGGWSCSNGPGLINDYSGTPNSFGAGYQTHLAALATAATAPPPPATIPGTATSVVATLTQNWGSGGVVNLHITNTGSTALGSSALPWRLSMSLPTGATISSMWNATLGGSSSGHVTAAAPSYALSLAPGASLDVGYVEQGSTGLPNSISVTAPPAGGAAGVELSTTYQLTAAWNGGGNGAINVTNVGSATSKPWTLQFTLPAGTNVTGMWCANLVSQVAGVVTATGPSWAVTLPPGGSDTVGWTQAGSIAAPTSVTVAG